MPITVLELNAVSNIAGWRLSRDVTVVPEWAEVALVDAPVNELPTALLHFTDMMVLEREIFTTARNHVLWARTSRVDDPLQYTVPADVMHLCDIDLHHTLRDTMKFKKEMGAVQDDWRMWMPISASTAWTARMNLRDIALMCKYFFYLSTRVSLLAPRFTYVANALKDILLDFAGPYYEIANDIVTMYRAPRYLNEERMDVNPLESYKTKHHHIIMVNVPLALRAQIVRHRQINFVDSFFHDVLCHANVMDIPLSYIIGMELSAPTQMWQSIVGKRSCWIAQSDLWAPITSQFDGSVLPCADGLCPYGKDAEARLQPGADPNPPCPRYMNLTSKSKVAWHAPMLKEARKRGQYWVEEVFK